MDKLILSRLDLPEVARLCAAGVISVDEMEWAWKRRNSSPRGSMKLRRREPRSPDKVASHRRRRSIAGAGWLPPTLAAHFSTGLQAVLGVIARECLTSGSCSFCNDRIAALAGVCVSTVKNAVREAVRLGLLVRQVRPRFRQKHDTSVLTIVSSEWRTWLRFHPMSEGSGGKKVPTTKQDISLRESLPQRRGIYRHFEPSGEALGQRERERGRLRA